MTRQYHTTRLAEEFPKSQRRVKQLPPSFLSSAHECPTLERTCASLAWGDLLGPWFMLFEEQIRNAGCQATQHQDSTVLPPWSSSSSPPCSASSSTAPAAPPRSHQPSSSFPNNLSKLVTTKICKLNGDHL